jgi:hypothetical protein
MSTPNSDLWEQERPGVFSRGYCEDDLPAVYTVREIALKRGQLRYCADVLTEVGRHQFGNKFHTQQGARRFCERHYRDWQKKQRFHIQQTSN